MAMNDEMMDPELEGKVVEAADAENALYAQMAPKGRFSKMALNSLVKGLNRVLPLFGIKEEYPSFSADATEFPVEFVKQLGMVQKAVEDAASEDAVPMELTFTIEDIGDDRSLTMIAAKLDRLSKLRDFKQFLTAPRSDVVEDTAPEQGGEELPEDSEASIDSLFLSRM